MNNFDFDDFNFLDDSPRNASISIISDIDATKSNIFETEINAEKEIPILPLRNTMLFPGTLLPITIGRRSSLRMINEVSKSGEVIGVFSQKDDSVDNPDSKDLYEFGVVAKVVKVLELPDGNRTALMQGFNRVGLTEAHDNGDYLVGHVYQAAEVIPSNRDREFNAVVEACKDVAEKLYRSSEFRNFDVSFNLRNLSNKTFLINFICANLPVSNKEKIDLLRESNMTQRGFMLLGLLNREYQFVSLKASIQMRTQEDLSRQQREFFLHQEMKNIQEELGEDSDSDIEGLQKRAKKKKWNEKTGDFFNRELGRLRRMNPQSPDYQTQFDYLDTFVSLPWNEATKDNLNLKNAEKVLNQDHFGMEKVKERILEHLAVLKTRGDFKSPIICLYGPPGVGKTSLGKSIARSMKREYVRMSLGGLHEEAEIRGHRRTYVGAMPGRIMKGIQQAKSCNPVFILDEIDKLGQDTFHGDPSSALLEVLDPEQNNAFHDNYLDCDFDLSRVMFIATANNIGSIPTPLLDRMELIEVSGYLTEEKIEIAKRHLIPQQLNKLGMEGTGIKLTPKAIERIIENYTRESGVRELDKKLNKLLRKLTLEFAKTGELHKKDIGENDIEALLGPVEFTRDKYQGNDYAGVVTGLAWTAVGGEILFIETSLSKGKGQKLTLTGNLGDVMKESAVLALEYIKAHAEKLNIDPRVFDNWNIHIHVPEGAVPKDGPSAGITIATSIASALTQRKVRKNVAMTGEITLRGKVLPVGGIKEKILAAKRAGITDIMLCHENEKDIKQIPEIYVKGVTFHYVKNVEDVWDFALLDEKVKNAIEFKIEEEEKKGEK
ncbi:MAG: endopeptidase La [Bacteroidaceae bacterium]|nr:endopeptidase La [Bacteroidaceae bacterium]